MKPTSLIGLTLCYAALILKLCYLPSATSDQIQNKLLRNIFEDTHLRILRDRTRRAVAGNKNSSPGTADTFKDDKRAELKSDGSGHYVELKDGEYFEGKIAKDSTGTVFAVAISDTNQLDSDCDANSATVIHVDNVDYEVYWSKRSSKGKTYIDPCFYKGNEELPPSRLSLGDRYYISIPSQGNGKISTSGTVPTAGSNFVDFKISAKNAKTSFKFYFPKGSLSFPDPSSGKAGVQWWQILIPVVLVIIALGVGGFFLVKKFWWEKRKEGKDGQAVPKKGTKEGRKVADAGDKKDEEDGSEKTREGKKTSREKRKTKSAPNKKDEKPKNSKTPPPKEGMKAPAKKAESVTGRTALQAPHPAPPPELPVDKTQASGRTATLNTDEESLAVRIANERFNNSNPASFAMAPTDATRQGLPREAIERQNAVEQRVKELLAKKK